MDSCIDKASIRQKVWDYLEEHDIAAFPRPVHHRIPNFKGAPEACNRLTNMDVFKRAKTIKVNPDKPQQQARFLALEAHKTLLVPTPRLRTGLFNRITPPPGANKNILRTCSSSQGVRQYSSPIGLNSGVKVDLVIIGSVAVSPKGYRIGKGEGYADMEYAMMSSMGAVNQNTVVITTVHDCQVMDELPEHLFGEHDLGVDFILTPTRTIECENRRAKPTGIAWQLLSFEKFSQIPVLTILRRRELEMGIDVRLKEEREQCSDSSTAVLQKDTHNARPCGTRRYDKNPGKESASTKHLSNYRAVLSGGVDSSSGVSLQASYPHQGAAIQRPREQSTNYYHNDRTMSGNKNSEHFQKMTERNTTESEYPKSDYMAGPIGSCRSRGEISPGQRSKGQKPTSGRKKDLKGMFAWNN